MRIPRSSLQGLDRDYGGMTPMIDVVFNLLIFFVIGAGAFTSEKLLATNLSATNGTAIAAQTVTDSAPWALSVTLKLSNDAGRLSVDMNGTVYQDRDQLKSQLLALAEVGPESPIILDIARDVPLGDMIDIYDACRAAGFQSINFAAGAKQTGGPG
jgi:biopolymer transport protein ExbD